MTGNFKSNIGSVTETNKGCFFNAKLIHHRDYILCHYVNGEPLFPVAGFSMASAVYCNDTKCICKKDKLLMK